MAGGLASVSICCDVKQHNYSRYCVTVATDTDVNMNVNTITVTGPRSRVAALYPLQNPAAGVGVGGEKTSPLLSPAPVAAHRPAQYAAQPAPSLTYLLFTSTNNYSDLFVALM